jgi:Tol biopolymer transport system component
VFSGDTPPPTPTPEPSATLEEGIVLPTATITPSNTPNVRSVSPTPGTPFPTNTPTETPLPTETLLPTATLPPLTDFTVYGISGGEQSGTLYRALGDGTGVQRLAENVSSIDTRPGLNLIVFTRPVAAGEGDAATTIVQAFIGTPEDIDNAVQATRLTRGAVEAVSLSPDGSQIAYASTEDGDSELYILNVQTGIVQKLSDNDSIDTQPVWSNDGTRIMFISDRDALGRTDVYVRNLADNTDTRLIDASGSASNPRWSPDGTRIIFGDVRGGATSLVLTDGAGSGGRLLQTGDALEVTVPVWSADGRYLVYVARRENRADEIVFQSVDTGERQGVIFPEMPNIADVAVR